MALFRAVFFSHGALRAFVHSASTSKTAHQKPTESRSYRPMSRFERAADSHCGIAAESSLALRGYMTNKSTKETNWNRAEAVAARWEKWGDFVPRIWVGSVTFSVSSVLGLDSALIGCVLKFQQKTKVGQDVPKPITAPCGGKGTPMTRSKNSCLFSLVRMGRLELPRPCERWNLNPVRLPIPPHPHNSGESVLDYPIGDSLFSRQWFVLQLRI